MPRFDALAEAVRSVVDRERTVVLIAPSWRCDARGLGFAGIHHSGLFRPWFELAESTAFKQLRAAGGRIIFFLHPNVAGTGGRVWEWDGAEWSSSNMSIQDAIVRTRVAVTDHSSITFDAMLCGASGVSVSEVIPNSWPGTWEHAPFGEALIDAVITAFHVETESIHDALTSPLDGGCCRRIIETVQSPDFLGGSPSLAYSAEASSLTGEHTRARVEKETGRWTSR